MIVVMNRIPVAPNPAQAVEDAARGLQEQVLSPGQQTEAPVQQGSSSRSLSRRADPATKLVNILCRLRTETEPARVAELRHLAAGLDEEVRREVRQYARERAALARKDDR